MFDIKITFLTTLYPSKKRLLLNHSLSMTKEQIVSNLSAEALGVEFLTEELSAQTMLKKTVKKVVSPQIFISIRIEHSFA